MGNCLAGEGALDQDLHNQLLLDDVGGSTIEFLTDVEGDWEYFITFVSRSAILSWHGDPRGVWGPGDLRLREGGILVFGGDSPDKGPGDIRFAKTLLGLRRRYPLQVFIIIGNRDLMKLRFAAELDDGAGDPWLPPWDKNVTPFKDFLAAEGLPRNRVGKLKWLLHCTMGCQTTTFQTRKDELAHLHGTATDEDVVQSYISPVDPNGRDPWMLEYLRAGQIALVLGDTLFVHGGVQDDSLFEVPGMSGDDVRPTSVQGWALLLNKWKDDQLRDFQAGPSWRSPGSGAGPPTRAAADLILYGTPGFGSGTVIYYNPFVSGNPVQRSAAVQERLAESGIRRLLTGHQPHGQAPTVVRHPSTGLLAVTADTSRSDNNGCKVMNPANNRGLAVSLVRIEGPWLHVQGLLNDGTPHGYSLNVEAELDPFPDKLVGRQLVDKSWIKTVLRPNAPTTATQGRRCLVQSALGQGFEVRIENIVAERACMMLRKQYGWGRNAMAIPVGNISSNMLMCDEPSFESCHDHDHEGRAAAAACAEAAALSGSSFELNTEEFESASTYVFAFNGVVKNTQTERRESVVSTINRLIAAQRRVVFITNDSTMSRAQFFNKIAADYGVDVDGIHIVRETLNNTEMTEAQSISVKHQLCTVTSSHTCAWYLQHHQIKRPFVICYQTGLLTELRSVGITDYFATVDETGRPREEFQQPVTSQAIAAIIAAQPDIDAVVVGWDHQLTALTIAVAAQYVRWSEDRGARMPVVTCSADATGIVGTVGPEFEATALRDRKVMTVGNGTMADAICQTVGPHVKAIDVGKPSGLVMEFLRRPPVEGGLGVDFDSAVMIGDSLEADVRFANKCGMKSLLVLSGVTDRAALREMRRQVGSRDLLPTWVVNSVADITAFRPKAVGAAPNPASP